MKYIVSFHVKTLLLILFISLFSVNQARSQQNKLPDEIEKYYHERNFINSFSLRDERQYISTLLSNGEDLSRLKEERLYQVAEVKKGLMDKVLPPYDPMSAGHVLPVQLLIPEINELAGWRINEDHIKVTLYTYSIDHGNNMKFIASYSPDQVPGDYEPVDLSILHYMSLEVHEWFLENDAWKKSSVNKILVE